MEKLQLDKDQKRALELLKNGKNVFITGNAGCGKSVVLNRFREEAPGGVVFLAPTGMAAMQIGGSTIHRFGRFPAALIRPEIGHIIGRDMTGLMREVAAIVIDEISMVRSDVFHALDALLKSLASGSDREKPFGGKQIAVVGDFGQLAPVVSDYLMKMYLEETFGGVWAFQTQAWKEAQFEHVKLRHPHRQAGDLDYLEILDDLRGDARSGSDVVAGALDRLNRSAKLCMPIDDVPTLTPTTMIANPLNYLRDARLGGDVFRFRRKISGIFDKEMYPTKALLEIRVGSRVMMLKNKYSMTAKQFDAMEWVNGELGRIVAIDPNARAVEVALDRGKVVLVEEMTWLNQRYLIREDPVTREPGLQQVVIGSFTQFPMTLAYAFTIHKSQGLNLSAANVTLGRRGPFAAGQLYTALSRVSSREGLSMDRPLTYRDVMIDPDVVAFLQSLK